MPSIASRLWRNSSAARGFGSSFDSSVLALLGTECNHSMTRFGKDGYHFLSATFGQVIREEPPVTDNDSEGDGMWLGVLM